MRSALVISFLLLAAPPASPLMPDKGIASLQAELASLPAGDRIARWAEEFVGTPYDPDPMGEYVTQRAIVSDQRVDCMYLAFRSVELALSRTPREAVEAALRLRFRTRGVLDEEGRVANYEERYRYAMDMLSGGRWGREVTVELADTVDIPGSRGYERVRIIPLALMPEAEKGLLTGDMVFLVKAPQKRVVGEIIGHIGIIRREEEKVWLIHAGGLKNRGGVVKKVLFREYVKSMTFIGMKVSRF